MITRLAQAFVAWSLPLFPFVLTEAYSYPLDGFDETGIARLEGYYDSLQLPEARKNFVPGQLVSMLETELRLLGKDFDLPPEDRKLKSSLLGLMNEKRGGFSLSVLDLTSPNQPRYAGVNDERIFLPLSSGKVLVAMAFFNELARLYPEDYLSRLRILRHTLVSADEFSQPDTHEVPIWRPDTRQIEFRPLMVGDTANLYTFLDWMLSASSNAAGNTMMRELILLHRFGHSYPAPAQSSQNYLKQASPAELASELRQSMLSAIKDNDLNPEKLYHTSLFTSAGRARIPSDGSAATTREYLRLLLLIEQGRLVDPFSSIELKRLLLSTQTRIRYAASPALDSAAVYYKSGSLSRCTPERQNTCRQFYGDKQNIMNSLAIIESPAGSARKHYLVAISSDTPGQDSSAEHIRLAEEIERTINY